MPPPPPPDDRDEIDDPDDREPDEDGFDEYDDHEGRRSSDRRTWLLRIAAVAVLLLVGLGVYFGARSVLGLGGFDDYRGNGESDVLIQVQSGESTSAIAETLAQSDVVASSDAFTVAGEDNAELSAIQPGYYVMKTKMSGQAAVARIAGGDNRVGELQVEPGIRLDDTQQPNDSVSKGIYTKLSEASCTELNGKSTCVSARELRETVANSDLTSLGVPQWAASDAQRAEPARRIEGLIAPDVYQVRPGDDARTLLRTVLTGSAARLQASGLPDVAQNTGFTPYQVLVMGSLIQSEAVQSDFGKVSRVIYNRLQKKQELQFDSTVNYVLDRPEIRTSAADRARSGPYNTYASGGLPPTPIAAPSSEAVTAAAQPEDGNWLFFVKCETNGLSCFSETGEQHQRAIEDAQARDVY